jgi:hypothetical protein
MIRKLLALALAVAALVTMGAMNASAALAAAGILTSDGPFTMYGGEEGGGGNALTMFGQTIKCEEGSFVGEKVKGGSIEGADTTFTIKPTYKNCTVGILPATITSTGCDYVLHLGDTIAADLYAITMDLVCEAGKDFAIDIYLNPSAHKAGEVFCTYTIEAQTGRTGATFTDLTNGEVTLGGGFENLKAQKFGKCGSGETNLAKRDLSVIFAGKNGGGEFTGISISEL